MIIILNSKFRYLIVINFLGMEHLLLTEEWGYYAKKESSCLYLGTYQCADAHA